MTTGAVTKYIERNYKYRAEAVCVCHPLIPTNDGVIAESSHRRRQQKGTQDDADPISVPERNRHNMLYHHFDLTQF